MKIWPVLLDSRPGYFGHASADETLLCAPIGRESLLGRLCRQIEAVTFDAPTIVAPPGVSFEYHARMAALCPNATVVRTSSELARLLMPAETADFLLFVDPRCLPLSRSPLFPLVTSEHDPTRLARHLVAYASDIGGTRECVDVDDEGNVRTVQRYYKPAAWPFVAGVAASLVPVSSGVLSKVSIAASLAELRQVFVSSGVPSYDVPIQEGALDLTQESGWLAAVEHSVRAAVDERGDGASGSLVLVGAGHAIDATARVLGPVVIHAGARIEAHATVVGPALIGAGARVGAGAFVAHASIGVDSVVPAGRTVCDRAWFASADDNGGAASGEDPVATFSQRLARQGLNSPEPQSVAIGDDVPARAYVVIKRVIDVVVSTFVLAVLSPLLVLLAAAIWIDSRGPILFRHTREGLGGRLFGCLKFRTMHLGSHELQRQLKRQDKLDGPHFKMKSDPRITTVGRWLRATNLDELPQLFNVLDGDMSLVGPRPSPFRENQICVPWREGRLSVRPGITGLWQVCRHDRDTADFHQWIEYDLLYVRHLGPLLDLKILAATLLTAGGKFPVAVARLIRQDPTRLAAPAPWTVAPRTAVPTTAPPMAALSSSATPATATARSASGIRLARADTRTRSAR